MAPVAVDPTIRRQVVAAAREELAADPEAPVGRIARRAGVSRATFYRHFGSRTALLDDIAHTPRPDARTRILVAAQEMLVRSSLNDISMDGLARAADVSRGTLYRIFPGKAALLHGLIEEYSPFDAIRAIVAAHHDAPPDVVLPLIARNDRGSRRRTAGPSASDLPGGDVGLRHRGDGHSARSSARHSACWPSTWPPRWRKGGCGPCTR